MDGNKFGLDRGPRGVDRVCQKLLARAAFAP